MIYTSLLSYTTLFLLPFTTCVPHGPAPPPAQPPHWNPACLATSIHDFSWSLSLEYHAFWYFTTPSHQNSWGTVTFNLTNPAVGSQVRTARGTIHCQADSSRLSDFFYGDQWFPCLPSSPEVAAVLPDTQFRFFTHNRFDLNQIWVCNESLKPKTQQKP